MNALLAFIPFGLGTTEIVIIGIIMVLLFGNRLPGMMRNLGKSIPEFRKGIQGIEEPIKEAKSALHEAEREIRKT